MKKIYLDKTYILSVLLSCLFFVNISAQEKLPRKWATWDAPDPQTQLDREAQDDIKGLGRLFIPVMTEADYEPVFTVSNMQDSILKISRMGKSIWLRPGQYKIAYGSGALDQLMRRVVEIRAEDTTILEPDWSGLVIKIIDETRTSIREAYEIYSIPENDYFGVGYGAEEQVGEHLQTWVLQPGLYKIVKLGEHVNTYKNFTTVRLLPGELTHFTIVVNTTTKDFLGAGIIDVGKKPRKLANWSLFSTLYGSFTLNSSNDVTTEEQETSMIFVAQLDYNITYNSKHHYFSSRGLIEEGWNMQKKQASFRSNLDRMQMKNIYVFYFIKQMGFYGRVFLETNLVRKINYFDNRRDVTFLDENDQIIEQKLGVRDVQLSPNFSPLELKEGFGINLILLKSLRANLNIRAGMGWHQIFNRDLYNQTSDTTFKALNSSFARGPEASLIGSARISRNMLLSCELEVFYPEGKGDRVDYEFENILNLKLSKNVSLDYTLRFRNKKSLSDYLLTDHIVLLRYSFFPF